MQVSPIDHKLNYLQHNNFAFKHQIKTVNFDLVANNYTIH